MRLIPVIAIVLLAAATADARGVRGGGARTSVSRGGAVAASRPAASSNRNVSNTNTNRNVNRNVNRDINRDIDRDVDVGYGNNAGYGYHPVARGAAIATGAAITAAAIGSVVYSLPSSCTTVVEMNVTYQYCDGSYYQPRYAGSSVEYVVVSAP